MVHLSTEQWSTAWSVVFVQDLCKMVCKQYCRTRQSFKTDVPPLNTV